MALISGISPAILFLIIFLIILASASIKILREYERGVIFRLGRLIGAKGPGIIFIIPGVDKLLRISLRTVALEIPPQDVITRDNISLKVNAVVYFRVVDPNKAVVQIENYLYATSQLAQTTLRSIIGQSQLDELLSERDKINIQLQDMLDKQTEPWGIKVSLVETKQVDLDTDMQRAIARQAEAERERRAKVIHAEGEAQAAEKLAEAANIISVHPAAMHLRFLQTLTEVSTEKNSTMILPIPIDLLKSFFQKKEKG
ncbi:MAG TPA: slipin family protein [Thermodesulfobacteriota bacterium]|nr:slipin family protein [Thermodesulfobacteriota bacterium]